MKLLLEHPEHFIANNKNLGRAHHTWVAVGITVAGTAISAGGSMLSNAQANKKTNAAMGGMPNFNKQNDVPYDPVQGSQDLMSMYPNLANFASSITADRTAGREKIMTGSKSQFSLASGVLQSWLKGEVPKDVIDFTNRNVAERTGGTFNPWTGGGNSQQAFSRSIGQLSSDFTSKGISAAPAWQQLANSFVVTADQVAPLAFEASSARYRYDVLNSQIDEFNKTGAYTAGTNKGMLAINQANTENAQQQQMWGQIGNGLTGAAAAYRGYRTPSTSSSPSTAKIDLGQYPKSGRPISQMSSWTPA